MKSKTKGILIVLTAVLFLSPLAAAKAAGIKTGNSIYVAKSDIIAGNLYSAAQTITIDGVISGDLIAAAQTINVNGRIEGDLIAAAQNIIINGEVGGNIRIAGDSLTLNGEVTRNLNAFGANVILGSNSRVGWDVYLAGVKAEIRGTINGGLSGQAERALITGSIGKNINLKLANDSADALTIAPEAVISGNLIYTAKNAANISERATITGQITQELPKVKKIGWFLAWLLSRLFALSAAFVVGLALIIIGKQTTPKLLEQMERKPSRLIIPGLVIFFVLPPLAFILGLTLIGLPLAFIIIGLWLISICLAKVLTALLVGKFLIKKVNKQKEPHLIWALLLGVVICWLLFAIPFVGWLIGLIAVWLGLGGLWSYARQS